MLSSLRFLAPYLRPYRFRYVAGVVLTVLAGLLGVCLPLLVREAVNGLSAGRAVLPVAVAIAGIGAVRACLQFSARTVLLRTGQRVVSDLRRTCLRRLTRLGPDFYHGNVTGDLTSRLINDTEPLRMVAGFGISVMIGMSFFLSACVGVMLWMNPGLTVTALVPLALIPVIFGGTSALQRERADEVQGALGDISAAAQEHFSGVRVVRAGVMEEAETLRMRGLSDRFLERTMAWTQVRGACWASLVLLTEAAVGIVLWMGGAQVAQGTMGVGDLFAFIQYEFMLLWPLIAMGWVVTLLHRGSACAERIELILKAPGIEPGEPGAPTGPAAVEIRGLTFTHAGRTEPVLRELSLKIERGRRVALVGRIGCGKSTLARLLAGLTPPPPGTILLDGQDVSALPPAQLRRQVSFVPQDGFLFSDTLRENIAFGSVEPVDPDQIVVAARTAGLEEEVRGLPDGFGTLIGERGITLSGGQRQRACLARALVKNAPMVVLDDAFAAVDVHTEGAILRNLDKELAGRTVLWITHRLTSLRGVDRIAVLEGGRIVEEGDFETLVAAGGPFARMLQRQAIEEELDAP